MIKRSDVIAVVILILGFGLGNSTYPGQDPEPKKEPFTEICQDSVLVISK